MSYNFHFDPGVLQTLVGGTPSLDIQRLNIRGLDEAHHFVKAYGYDLSSEKDLDLLWRYYRRAVNYIRTHLLQEGEEIPEMLADPNQLKNLAYLLIYASTREVKQNSVQNWACAILRVMHVLVHLENDLFFSFLPTFRSRFSNPSGVRSTRTRLQAFGWAAPPIRGESVWKNSSLNLLRVQIPQ